MPSHWTCRRATAPTPFLDDDTGLSFHARAFSNDINFSTTLGLLGLFVQGGQAGVKGRAELPKPLADDDCVSIDVFFADTVDGDGRILFADLCVDDLTVACQGAATANLPFQVGLGGGREDLLFVGPSTLAVGKRSSVL